MKKVLIFLGIAAILVIGYFTLSFFYLTRLASPQETVQFENEGFQMSVTYCRPSKKGRLIFGGGDSDALLPYGKYWRLGANQATEIEFNKDLVIEGQTLEMGRYRLYAIPGKETWELVFNTELGEWGAMEANHEKDKYRISVPVEKLNDIVEMFSITILSDDVSGQNSINFFWDKALVSLDFSYE
jgi:Protein of unknown function (DUF2911)